MNKIETGMVVMLLPCPNPKHNKHAGEIRIVGTPNSQYVGEFNMGPPMIEGGKNLCWAPLHLRPIRDPGEDATDEMLLIVGRPNERVPA